MPQQRYDALIFDLDGTLWDAAAASAYGWNLALAELGLAPRVTVDAIRSVSGYPFSRCVEILLPGLHPAPETLVRALDCAERRGLETIGGVLYQGVAEGLPRLAEVYRLFVVSNCPGWYLEEFFRSTGLDAHLDGYDCHGSSGVGKPEMLARLCATHAVGRAVYVGDTAGDREAALIAGLDFGFAAYGFGALSDAALSDAALSDAALSFGTFDELVEYFLRQAMVCRCGSGATSTVDC